MAPAVYASSTQTAVIGTEHFLSSPNVAGVYEFVVDLNAMVAGDVVELRVYMMTIAGGTSRCKEPARYADLQPTDSVIAVSGPVLNPLTDTNAVRFSLTQTKGTGRAFPWSVRSA